METFTFDMRPLYLFSSVWEMAESLYYSYNWIEMTNSLWKPI